jgi:hypothetical protein
MILQGRQPQKLAPRPDFRPEEFRKRIYSHGLPVKWEQSAECPCSQEAGDYGFTIAGGGSSNKLTQNRPDCPACKGRGYIYHSAQELRAVVTHAKVNDERFGPLGAAEYGRGLIGLTLLPEHLPALGDRFTLLASSIVFREVITTTGAAFERLRYPIASRSHDLAGGAVSFGVRFMIQSDGGGVVDPTATLEEGSAFQVEAGGRIEWIDLTQKPVAGVRLSVEYYAHPVYTVLDHPHSTRDTRIQFKAPSEYHQSLPVYAEAGLEFLGPSDV